MGSIVFITGTDTGVGKTQVTLALAHALADRGIRVLPVKPIETGCRDEEGRLCGADEQSFREFNQRYEVTADNWYRFKLPVAPQVAAEAELKSINLDGLNADIVQLASSYDVVLVEGAGGLMVPIWQGQTFCDLLGSWQASVLLVVGSRLGCLNHALLTLEVLRSRSLPILGYVLNELSAICAAEDQSLRTNRTVLAELAVRYAVRELAVFPYLSQDLPDERVSREIFENSAEQLAAHVIESSKHPR